MAPSDRVKPPKKASGGSFNNLIFDPRFGANIARSQPNKNGQPPHKSTKSATNPPVQQRRTQSTNSTLDPKLPNSGSPGGIFAALRSKFRKGSQSAQESVVPNEPVNQDEQQSIKETLLPKEAGSQDERTPVLPDSEMENLRVPSSLNRLSVQLSRGQIKTRQEAKEQEAVIHERLRRANQPIPPYEFQNYIGKGSYGRVYVARDKNPEGRGRVAVKVLDIDAVDFKVHLQHRDQSYEDFLKELKTLQQLRSAGARNVNQIFEVLEVHSQFWIISEYCPGGSVHTLMQATNNKVQEKYLIPIARELAIGLDAVHKACIIHRDVKAANVMIHEEGALQIIDFGVAGMLHNEGDKRKTMIGTPHWMGPEALNPKEQGYGTEVDTWAFGCTLHEMATGAPPRSRLGHAQLDREFRLRGAPKLRVDQGLSQGLCDLVAFTLVLDPEKRPSMEQILEHPYLKDTELTHPTWTLREFVCEFEDWAKAGGQRHSLFNNFGAAAAELAEDIISKPEWRFSTLEATELMEELPASIDEQEFLDNDHPFASHLEQVTDMSSTQAQEDAFNSYNASEPSSPYLSDSDLTPGGSPKAHGDMTPPSESASVTATNETKVTRGEKQLGRLFDPHKSLYTYSGLNAHQSDLPLRDPASESIATSSNKKEVEANTVGPSNSGNIALADPATLKAKRKDRPPTMAWDFPGEATEAAPKVPSNEPQPQQKRAFMDWKFPEAGSDGYLHEPNASQSSGMSDHGSDADNHGASNGTTYNDSHPTSYEPPTVTNYVPSVHSAGSVDFDTGGTRDRRETLNLDDYGASDTDTDTESANKARQTLDLDALMGDMGLSSGGSASYPEPQSTGGMGPSRNFNTDYDHHANRDHHTNDEFTHTTPHPDTEHPSTRRQEWPLLPDFPRPRPGYNQATDVFRSRQLPPNVRGPSAQAMSLNCPDDVLEAEFRRMLNDYRAHISYYKGMLEDCMEANERKMAQEAAKGQNGGAGPSGGS